MSNLNEILAYKEIKKIKNLKKKISFNDLFKIIKKCNGGIFEDLKIYMILTIKWHFDYLAKTRSFPNELNLSLKYWHNIFTIFLVLEKQGWIKSSNKKKLPVDVWKNTKKSFNFMWPRNTSKRKYDTSKVMVDLRINQIMKMIRRNNRNFNNMTVLDFGCGPGRYMESLLRFNPKKLIGIDSGKEIINTNKKRFKKYKKMKFVKSNFDKLYIKENSIDLLISAGVLHHIKTNLSKVIQDHARVIKKEGFLFVFIVGKGGQELDLWKFCRRVMNTTDIKYVYSKLENQISHLRLQGLLDHSYGEYKSISRKPFEKILKKYFSKIERVKGVPGADVTVNTFKNDKYFKLRFGTGNLRYLCTK